MSTYERHIWKTFCLFASKLQNGNLKLPKFSFTSYINVLSDVKYQVTSWSHVMQEWHGQVLSNTRKSLGSEAIKSISTNLNHQSVLAFDQKCGHCFLDPIHQHHCAVAFFFQAWSHSQFLTFLYMILFSFSFLLLSFVVCFLLPGKLLFLKPTFLTCCGNLIISVIRLISDRDVY